MRDLNPLGARIIGVGNAGLRNFPKIAHFKQSREVYVWIPSNDGTLKSEIRKNALIYAVLQEEEQKQANRVAEMLKLEV